MKRTVSLGSLCNIKNTGATGRFTIMLTYGLFLPHFSLPRLQRFLGVSSPFYPRLLGRKTEEKEGKEPSKDLATLLYSV